ncbi:hypothetical protein EDB80DRAFT_876428 [Ilyonectria destructans]|nr:hypothetical protein EDB80DRAFT_876428 [Ilyonectria destructans]
MDLIASAFERLGAICTFFVTDPIEFGIITMCYVMIYGLPPLVYYNYMFYARIEEFAHKFGFADAPRPRQRNVQRNNNEIEADQPDDRFTENGFRQIFRTWYGPVFYGCLVNFYHRGSMDADLASVLLGSLPLLIPLRVYVDYRRSSLFGLFLWVGVGRRTAHWMLSQILEWVVSWSSLAHDVYNHHSETRVEDRVVFLLELWAIFMRLR